MPFVVFFYPYTRFSENFSCISTEFKGLRIEFETIFQDTHKDKFIIGFKEDTIEL